MAKYYVIGKNLTPESREFLMKSFCTFVKRSEIFFCLMDKESDLIREDILRKKPSVLVLLGAEASKEFCPKFKFISTSRGKLFDFSYKDFSCKSIVTYNPQYVNSSPGNLEEYGPIFLKDLEYSYNFVTGKLIDVNTKNLRYAKTFKEFKEYFDTYLKDAELPAYDIETNAKDPRSEAFKIIGYSLAPNGSTGIYIIRESLEYSMPEEDWQKCVELTKEYIMSRPVLVHNIMYEMPSTLNEWGVKITNFEDSLIKARLLLGGKTGAGLKEQCTRNLGYPDWDSDLHTYFSCIEELISALKPTPAGKIRDDYTVLKQLGFSGLIKYYESKDSLTAKQDSAKEAIETLKEVVLNYYSEEDTYIFDLIGKEIVSLIDIQFEGVLPYSSVPLKIITKYGALDSVGTQDLNKFLSERMDKESTPDVDLWNGYRLVKENFRVGADMELNGLYWNDQKATAVKDWLDSKAYNAMISMLRSGFLDRQIFENSQDLLTDYIREKELVAVEKILGPFELQKSGIKLLATGKRITWKNLLSALDKDFIESHYQQIVDYVKTNLENKEIFPDYEVLKKFFNPSSTASKEILHSILMSKELKLASAVFEIGEDIQSGTVSIDKIPLPDRNIYTAYKNVLDYNKKIKDGEAEGEVISQKDLFKKIAYGLEYVTPKSNSLKKIIEKAASFEIDSTEESVIISVFNYMSAMGYDIEDESTWDEKFRFLIDFRTFKKCTKLISTYIEGAKVGRGSVWVVNKEELENGTELPVRKRKYSELEEGEDYLMQGTWGVCFTGDTLIKGLDGEDYSFKDLVDNGVKELWVFSIDESGDVTPSLAKEIRKTRENAELVEIKLNSGKIIRCTPNHLFLLNNGEYKEARQLTLTDKLRAFLFNDYNEIYENKDCYAIEIKHLDYTEDVYDLTVPGYENFVLSAGPTVHNCTTNTLRWRSGVHTLPSSPMIKGVYTSRFKGGVIAAPDYCLTGDTEVLLLDDTKQKLKDLEGVEEFFVYSYDESSGKVVAGRGHDCRIVRQVDESIRLTFDDNSVIECSLDHTFMRHVDKRFTKAEDLKVGDTLETLQPFQKGMILADNLFNENFVEIIHSDRSVSGFLNKSFPSEVIKVFSSDLEGKVSQNVIYDKKVSHSKISYRLYFDERNYLEVAPGQKILTAAGVYKYPDELGGYAVMSHYTKQIGDVLKIAKYDPSLSRIVVKIDKVFYPEGENFIQLSVDGEHNYLCPVQTDSENNVLNIVLHNDSSYRYITKIEHIKHEKPLELYCFTVDKYHNFYTGQGVLTHQSQQEIRVVSSLSNCQGLLMAYQNNEDVHMKTAMSVFHKPAEEISKNERRFCKMACRVGSSKVQLANGKIMTMEEIFEKGMKSFFVYSMNIYSKRTMFGQVVDVQQTKFVNDTVILEFEGDLTDECTPDHLYLCDDYEYREAKDLKGHKVKALQVGEKLSEVLCTNVTEKHYEEAIPVYDLSVYIFHNYSAYIGKGISVYTHNTFSILYGATAQGLANTAETSVEEAQKMIDGFFATYPEIKTWMDERHKEVLLSGKVSCPKVGYFLNIDKNGPGGLDEAYKQAGNFPVQGQASIMAGYVLSKINNYLKEHKMKTVPISFIHDSLEFDIHPLELFKTCKTIIELMNGIPKEEFNIPSKADLTIGNSMGDENTVLSIKERDDGGEIELEGFEDNLDELYNRWKEVYSSVTYEDNPDSEVDVYVPMKELFMPKLTITKYSGTHRKTIVRKFFIKF